MPDEEPFVISENCVGSVDQSCLEVCPVDCIYSVGDDPDNPGEPYFMVIDPDECISCGICVAQCPVEAIHLASIVPEKWKPYIEINAMHAGRGDNSGPAEEEATDKQDIADAVKALIEKSKAA